MALVQTMQARLMPAGQQVVEVVVDRGYHPATIIARAGVPLRLVFRRQDLDVCTERVSLVPMGNAGPALPSAGATGPCPA